MIHGTERDSISTLIQYQEADIGEGEPEVSGLGLAIKRAQHVLRTRMDREMRPLGLTALQYAVLASLEAEPGASNAELARRAFVTPQTMQTMLAALERAGLVARSPDQTRGRIRRTAPTAASREVLSHPHAVAAGRVARAAARPLDPEGAASMLVRCAGRLS